MQDLTRILNPADTSEDDHSLSSMPSQASSSVSLYSASSSTSRSLSTSFHHFRNTSRSATAGATAKNLSFSSSHGSRGSVQRSASLLLPTSSHHQNYGSSFAAPSRGASFNTAVGTGAIERINLDPETLVRETVEALVQTSQWDVFRAFDNGLEQRDELEVQEIMAPDESGLSNCIDFKVYLESSPHHPAVLARFVTTQGNPNYSFQSRYCLDMEYEFALIKRLYHADSSSSRQQTLSHKFSAVPIPYGMQEVPGGGGKLRLTEFISPFHCKPWANQFLEGSYTLAFTQHLMSQFTNTLAKLHTLRRVDRHLLRHIQTRVTNLKAILPRTSLTRAAGFDLITRNRVTRLLEELGEQTCSVITGAMINDYHRSDCIIHNDLSLFQVMMMITMKPSSDETTPEDESEASFGEDKESSFGNEEESPLNNHQQHHRLVIPHWQTARTGPIGRDLGIPIAWPLACLFWHANQGREATALEILEFITAFWDSYSRASNYHSGKNHRSMSPRVFRNMMAWCGWFLYVQMYQGSFHMDQFSFAGPNAAQDKLRFFESIGVVGLNLMHVGFSGLNPEFTIEELRAKFLGLVQDELKG